MARRKASESTEEEENARWEQEMLAPITPQQQTFIETLLTGKNLTDAALTAKISRRTATYWMNNSKHPVRLEYEKQRLAAEAHVASRIAGLHELAFKALEDLLAATAPAQQRFQAAKLIYETALQTLCSPRFPQTSIDLVHKEVKTVYEESQQLGSNRVMLFDDKGRERLFYYVDPYAVVE